MIGSFRIRSAPRSLILCALGAVIGLVIAGFGLFTAHGTRTATVPAENVALVNGVPILMSDYLAQLRALHDVTLSTATADERRTTLDAMIREELFVQRGVELGVQSDTIEVREALVGAVEAQTAADATMAVPSEAELHAFYAAHRGDFADEGVMALADYRLPPGTGPAAVAQAATALRAGRTAAVPRSGAMTDGEEYYFAARRHIEPALFAIAARLQPGEQSAPITLGDGIHIVVMTKNVPPAAPPFAAVRDKVLAAAVDAQAKRLIAANARFLHKRADIQVAPGFE